MKTGSARYGERTGLGKGRWGVRSALGLVLGAALLLPAPHSGAEESDPEPGVTPPWVLASAPASIAASETTVLVSGDAYNFTALMWDWLDAAKNGVGFVPNVLESTVTDHGGGHYTVEYLVDVSGLGLVPGDQLQWAVTMYDYDWTAYFDEATTNVN
ncbi:MAG: hypothetical protein KatS3mg102_1921 [Planctomycetota bacterium]|nr:MAG: hypothetical protein KatS3mg102_1921 [Planctomycetota bacterium]